MRLNTYVRNGGVVYSAVCSEAVHPPKRSIISWFEGFRVKIAERFSTGIREMPLAGT
jgi:hypothetical protein